MMHTKRKDNEAEKWVPRIVYNISIEFVEIEKQLCVCDPRDGKECLSAKLWKHSLAAKGFGSSLTCEKRITKTYSPVRLNDA